MITQLQHLMTPLVEYTVHQLQRLLTPLTSQSHLSTFQQYAREFHSQTTPDSFFTRHSNVIMPIVYSMVSQVFGTSYGVMLNTGMSLIMSELSSLFAFKSPNSNLRRIKVTTLLSDINACLTNGLISIKNQEYVYKDIYGSIRLNNVLAPYPKIESKTFYQLEYQKKSLLLCVLGWRS